MFQGRPGLNGAKGERGEAGVGAGYGHPVRVTDFTFMVQKWLNLTNIRHCSGSPRSTGTTRTSGTSSTSHR